VVVGAVSDLGWALEAAAVVLGAEVAAPVGVVVLGAWVVVLVDKTLRVLA
jgi:hypothetical protein